MSVVLVARNLEHAKCEWMQKASAVAKTAPYYDFQGTPMRL